MRLSLCLFWALVCAHFALAGNLAPTAPETTLRQQLAATYTSQVGVKEATGKNDGVEVGKYLATVGLGQGYHWCAAFVKWTFAQRRVATTGTNGRADTWFPVARRIYQRPSGYVAVPQQADLFGLYYANLGRIAHVGFIDHWDQARGQAATVEGNTNDGGSRNGDGVYRKRRLIRQIYAVSKWVPA